MKLEKTLQRVFKTKTFQGIYLVLSPFQLLSSVAGFGDG